jgi:hypothetical protein
LELPPSPKSHAQLVGPPLLVSVNCTGSGNAPDVGVAVNEAVGWTERSFTSNTNSARRSGSPAGRVPPSETYSWSPTSSTPRGSSTPNGVRSRVQFGTGFHVEVSTLTSLMLAGVGSTAATKVTTYAYAPSGENVMPPIAASMPLIVIGVPSVFVA